MFSLKAQTRIGLLLTILLTGKQACLTPPEELESTQGKKGDIVVKLDHKGAGVWHLLATVQGSGRDVTNFFLLTRQGMRFTEDARWVVTLQRPWPRQMKNATVRLTLLCYSGGETRIFPRLFTLAGQPVGVKDKSDGANNAVIKDTSHFEELKNSPVVSQKKIDIVDPFPNSSSQVSAGTLVLLSFGRLLFDHCVLRL